MSEYQIWAAFQQLTETLYAEGKITKPLLNKYWKLTQQRMDELNGI